MASGHVNRIKKAAAKSAGAAPGITLKTNRLFDTAVL
jgi:hypothetical protein